MKGERCSIRLACAEPEGMLSSPAFVHLALFAAVFFAGALLCSGDAYAVANSVQFCDQQRAAYPNQFLYPMMLCLTSAPQGFIPATALQVMQYIGTFYLPAIAAIATVVVAWFGVKLLTGNVQNLKADAFSILLKIAGTFYFIQQAPNIYTDLLNIMANLNDIIGQVIVNAGSNAFCAGPGQTLWQDLDCVFGFIFGVGVVAAIAGVIAIIILIIVTCGTGIVIVFALLYLIATAFFAVMRFLQVYVMAVMSLSFVFALGCLFVPLMFFRDTFVYFQKWLAYILAYVLIPFVMYAYMAMMFVVMDQTIFSGPSSIFYEVFGAQAIKVMNARDPKTSPFNQIQCPANCTPDPDPAKDTCGEKYCHTAGYSVGRLGSEQHDTQISSDLGSAGNMNYNGQDAYTFNSEKHDTMLNLIFHYNILDLSQMAQDQGDQKTVPQYLIDIAISICVAALLAYIMFSLMTFIPELASNLISQGTRAGSQVVKAEVFGEAVVMQTLELAKEAALAVATGGASASGTAAKMAGKMAAKRASGGGEEKKSS